MGKTCGIGQKVVTLQFVTMTYSKIRESMKKLLFALMAVLALTGCKKDYEEVKGDLSETRIYTLKNGL